MSQEEELEAKTTHEILLPPYSSLKIEKASKSHSIIIRFREFEKPDVTNCKDYFKSFQGFAHKSGAGMNLVDAAAGDTYKVYSKEKEKNGLQRYITVQVYETNRGIKTPDLGFQVLDYRLIELSKKTRLVLLR